ncbi:MAG: hypothetical protein AB7T14_03175 [Candidatus Methylacidiphilaceae bacterium]
MIPVYTEGQGPEDEARSNALKKASLPPPQDREDPYLAASLGKNGANPDRANPQSMYLAAPPALPEQLDPVNQEVAAYVQQELRSGFQTNEICEDWVARLYAQANAPLDPAWWLSMINSTPVMEPSLIRT